MLYSYNNDIMIEYHHQSLIYVARCKGEKEQEETKKGEGLQDYNNKNTCGYYLPHNSLSLLSEPATQPVEERPFIPTLLIHCVDNEFAIVALLQLS
jgi:hypothetical protein